MRVGQALNNRGHVLWWKHASDDERKAFYKDFIEQLAIHLSTDDALIDETLNALTNAENSK